MRSLVAFLTACAYEPQRVADDADRVVLIVENPSSAGLQVGFQVGFRNAVTCPEGIDGLHVGHDSARIPRAIDRGVTDYVWFRIESEIDAAATAEYWLECGAPDPTLSDPTRVFELYDDFSAPLAASTWAIQGTATVANGALTIANTDSGIHSVATFTPDHAIDFIAQASEGAVGQPWFWGGFHVDFSNSAPWVIWHSIDADQIRPSFDDARPDGNANWWVGDVRTLDTDRRLYGVEHHGDRATFLIDNTMIESHLYDEPVQQPMSLRLHNFTVSQGTVDFDMIRARQARDPSPTVTIVLP